MLMIFSGFSVPMVSATDVGPQTCEAPLDVMMVFDRSDSMSYDSWPNPIQPLEDAQVGTVAFIDVLNTGNDQVGLVDFYQYAELTHGLTTDFSAVKDSVNEMWLDGWTNIGAGIDTAHAELMDNGRTDIKKVIILLSDGNPNKPHNSHDAEEFAVAQANQAKADGVVIYTIGWGDDANDSFLEGLASSPSNYYFAPTSAGLENAYMQLAATVCVPENTKPVITLAYPTLDLNVGDVFDPYASHATADDAEDGDITGDVVASSSVNTAIAGDYSVEYNVVDSESLAADQVTLQVHVEALPVYACSDGEDNDSDGLVDYPADPGCEDATDDDEYNDISAETITLVASKIVCDNESDLPNWGADLTPIDANTVDTFMSTHGDVCEVVEWDLQWAPQNEVNPGDNSSAANAPWSTFTGSTTINLADIAGNDSVWVREVWSNGYIPFSGSNTIHNESAEIYCHIDSINYDNYDRVDAPFVADETYYCVAFNVPVAPVYQCSDGIDNDGDSLIDADDIGCWTDPEDAGTYVPTDDDETNTPVVVENAKPVITLAYPTLNLYVGDAFNPYGSHATANDNEDGDITGDINATSSVNTAVVGNYSVEYGVQDSEGLAADPVVLLVYVTVKTVVSGGGGGGSAYFPDVLTITNENVIYLGDGNATVTWNTNLPATSRVVFADNTVPVKGITPLYGYDATNEKNNALLTAHSMTIGGLVDGVDYYFRPVSDKPFASEVVGKEVTYNFTPIVAPVTCNYLLEYIKLGAANNPIEVEKLERFLNEFEGENLAVNGIYEQVDFEAVERFQNKYFSDILEPWNHTAPTGYVYITTKKKINEVFGL